MDLALLGAGNIALNGHIPALRSVPDLAEAIRVTACCDLVERNLEAARALLPGIRTYRSAEELLARERPDAVDICLPPGLHAWALREAAARRLDVLCEKPLCRTVAEAEPLAGILAESPIVFLPCHQYHYAPSWHAVADAVRNGEIGALRFVEWSVWRTEANPGNPHWLPAWRTDGAISGGGILMDHGVHVVYQLRSLLGDPVAVTARLRSLRDQSYAVEDTAAVILEYPETTARLGFTWGAPIREITSRLVGTRGEIRVTDDRIEMRRAGPRPETRTLRFESGLSHGSSHAAWFVPLFREFVTRVRRGDHRRDGWDEALASLRTLEACYDSASQGRTMAATHLAGIPAP